MTIPATTVSVDPITGRTGTTVQGVLEEISGSADYVNGVAANAANAAIAASTADAKAVNAQAKADTTAGTVDNYVAPLVGKMDSEMSQVFTALGLTRS